MEDEYPQDGACVLVVGGAACITGTVGGSNWSRYLSADGDVLAGSSEVYLPSLHLVLRRENQPVTPGTHVQGGS
jgi:hypothetical protein